MPGEQLLEAAGRNFEGAGNTAIASEDAATKKEQVRQQPGVEATHDINALVARATGDKAAMKLEQEKAANELKLQALKNKAGEIEIPPEVAIQMAKEFKDPSMFQFAGVPMNVRAFGALMSMKYKNKMAMMKPQFDGNMMITLDENGDPVKTDLTKYGFHYRPAGTGGHGGSKDPNKDDLAKKKVWLKEFNDRKKAIAGDAGMVMKRKNPDQYSREAAWIEDNEPKADEIMQSIGPGGSEGGGQAGASGGGGITDQDWSAIFQGTGK